MDDNTKIIENFSKIKLRVITQLFLDGSKNGNSELIIRNSKHINLVKDKYLGEIIHNLCLCRKYVDAILLAENTERIQLYMFTNADIIDLIDNENIDTIKTFITRFPEIFSRDYGCNLSHRIYQVGGLDLVKFSLEKSVACTNRIVNEMTYLACNRNHIHVLEYLIEEYHNLVKNAIMELIKKFRFKFHLEVIQLIAKSYPNANIFNNRFYCGMFKENNEILLQYIIDNFDNFNYEYFKYAHWNNIDIQIIKIIFGHSLEKNHILPIEVANNFFKKSCYCGDFETCYRLKSYYPDINHKDVKKFEKYPEISNWLQNDCPINCSSTKSAMKVV